MNLFRKSRLDADAEVKHCAGCFWGSAAVAAVSLYGSSKASKSADKAADVQAAAANDSTALQKYIYDNNIKLNQPFYDSGLAANNKLSNLAGVSGTPDFSGFYADPGYQFRMDEGNKAVERSAAGRNGLLSGATLKALTRYSQGLASSEYGNYTNRLASLAGVGQTASNTMGNLGTNYAGAASSNMQDAANARASGYIGSANAINSGISQGLNYYQNSQMINKTGGSGGYDSGAGIGGSSKPWWDTTSGPRTSN